MRKINLVVFPLKLQEMPISVVVTWYVRGARCWRVRLYSLPRWRGALPGPRTHQVPPVTILLRGAFPRGFSSRVLAGVSSCPPVVIKSLSARPYPLSARLYALLCRLLQARDRRSCDRLSRRRLSPSVATSSRRAAAPRSGRQGSGPRRAAG